MNQIFKGNDNYGNPKQNYIDKIKEMSDAILEIEVEHKIWLSAYAANNPRSDYHWHVDACYLECKNREKLDIYTRSYKNAF